MAVLIGGRYRLDRELAAGGFGTVWEAFDTTLRVGVAVKQVRLDPAATDAERAAAVVRAEHEARNAARLRDHPNIVAVHDVVTEGGTPWLVMQLVAGRSLQQELAARGRLAPDEAGRIAGGVLAALAAAHTAGIVHRDVKPANIMLADDGSVLLTDFGIAKHHADTVQTAHGTVIGSLPYMAPERLDGHSLAAGDLFALGVTLYEMTEGVSPFARDSLTAMMSAVVLHTPEAPKHAGSLTPLVQALLAKQHTDRPDAVAALALLGRSTARPAASPAVATTAVAPAAAATAGAPAAATAAVANVAAAAPIAETVAATPSRDAETVSGRRHGRALANELIRVAAGDDDGADEAQLVVWAMALHLADDEPRTAERLVDAIPETGWRDDARIALAKAVWRRDPQQAKRLIADISPSSGYHVAAMTLWRIDVGTAERLVRSENNVLWQSECLADLATAVASVDAADGERIARTVPLADWRAAALAAVAAAIAMTHPARARELAEEAVSCAAALTERPERAVALRKVAGSVALFDPQRAERIARSLMESFDQPDKRRARRRSRSDGSALLSFAPALAPVAAAVARTDPRRGWELAREAEAADLTQPTSELDFRNAAIKVGILGHLAAAYAATEPQRARQLAEEALRIAEAQSHFSVDAAVAVAGAFPDLADRVAATLVWDHSRDEMVARLSAGHPEAAAAATPATAAAVLSVAATDPHRAARLAGGIGDAGDRLAALVQLAEAVADREPDLTGRLCDDAEDTMLKDPDLYAVSDLLATAARAAADPHRTRTLPDELIHIAAAVPAGPARTAALGTAASLIAGLDPERAESMARDLEDEWRMWALGLVACCLIRGTDPQAWRPGSGVVTFARNKLFWDPDLGSPL
ncbi:serine/threonine-protein kinase [Catenulispora subtropica]|uniref:non-specific serine/threonine protein kinase n=1 Tax=Catenulispora subtropica TaxID=450798 RepID=A0ABP5C344_9ACTN